MFAMVDWLMIHPDLWWYHPVQVTLRVASRWRGWQWLRPAELVWKHWPCWWLDGIFIGFCVYIYNIYIWYDLYPKSVGFIGLSCPKKNLLASMMTSWDETWKTSVVPSRGSDGNMMVLSSKYRVFTMVKIVGDWGVNGDLIGFDAGFIV